MGTTRVIQNALTKSDLCRAAQAQGRELSPVDISDNDPNLKAAILINRLYAQTRETALQDPTNPNLTQMNRFDELCNLLASSKTTYDLYKKLQEQAMPHKANAIANHDRYEEVRKESEKQAAYLDKVLGMLAINITSHADLTPEAKEQIKVARQEQKIFADLVVGVIKEAKKVHTELEKDNKDASNAVSASTLAPTTTGSTLEPGE
jgi:hypothetical protein